MREKIALPPIDGWSWFDWCERAKAFLAAPLPTPPAVTACNCAASRVLHEKTCPMATATTSPAVTAEALAWVRSHAEANTHPTIRARAAEILAALTAPQDATPASKGDDNG